MPSGGECSGTVAEMGSVAYGTKETQKDKGQSDVNRFILGKRRSSSQKHKPTVILVSDFGAFWVLFSLKDNNSGIPDCLFVVNENTGRWISYQS